MDIDIKYDSSTLKNYKLVQPGDFIISLRSFQGGFETSYLTGITSPAYTIFNFIDNQSQNHMFWQYLFKRKNFINSLKKVIFGIRDGKAISFSQFGDVKVEYPDFDEQKHIAITLNKIDDTIQLHERKCEELTLIKKSLLQKLFPKEDKIKPEIRYKNFSDAWEQRKLGEVATRVTRKNKNLESTLPLTISARLGLVDQISYFDKRIASSNLTNYILLNRGEFAYNKSYSNGYPFGTVKRLNRYDKGVIPSLYIAFMPNTIFINSDFMEMYFETSLWHKEVSARASEGARNHGLLNISPSDFMDIYMKIPEKIEEQKKIAKFLEDFDSLIALHQRKLEKLKQLKKFLLQNMFI
ncbi:restriction endonuclease subunit S [Ligilactobacillus salivarius]|uniref:restriction endonuclease subunit S n=1 Tax=Ligilactobacillus salivarius TaxID=1624 RepID=UPI002072AAC7|nr:restriction endonuclease subunit S [Ligilactobacillus salivarius]